MSYLGDMQWISHIFDSTYSTVSAYDSYDIYHISHMPHTPYSVVLQYTRREYKYQGRHIDMNVSCIYLDYRQ